jgi:hypothetical protein
MKNPLENIPGGPAIWIGIIASAILAALQSLVGNGVIQPEFADTIASALDPTQGGWAIPLIIGVVTRFFVSPAAEVGWK